MYSFRAYVQYNGIVDESMSLAAVHANYFQRVLNSIESRVE
jgi:hypothetical protein